MHEMSEDYVGRQVDLEVLQHVSIPAGRFDLSMSATDGERKTTGIQKSIQRYVSLLLSPSSSRRFSPVSGNELLSSVVAGSVSNLGYLKSLFVLANAAVLDEMSAADYNTEKYGEVPDDERIQAVTLDSASVDTATSTVSLSLTFETYAGSEYTYVVPMRAEAR